MLFLVSSRKLPIRLRGNLQFQHVNLYTIAKCMKLPLFQPAYSGRGRIVNLSLLDRVVTMLKIRCRNNCSIILPDPKGRVMTQSILDNVCYRYVSGRHVILINPTLSGYDHRITLLHSCDMLSLGNVIVSTGEIVCRTIMDSLDRYYEISKGRALSKDSLRISHVPGTRDYTRPRVYKGYEVPSEYYSGNRASVSSIKLKEVMMWAQSHNYVLFLQLMYEYISK